MKNKVIILFLLLSLVSVSGYARKYSKNRHIQGTYGLDLSGGISSYGTVINLGYIQYLKSSKQNRYNLEYDFGNVGTTDYSNIRLIYTMQKSVYHINSDVFFNIKGGAIASFEGQKNIYLDKTNNKFVGGALVGLEIEGYINNEISLILNGQQLYLANSKIGKFSANLQLGIRYNF